jgi:hypothetical protein
MLQVVILSWSAGSWYHDLIICFGFGFLVVPGTFISVPGAIGGSWNDHLIVCFWFGLVFSVCQAPSYLCLEQMVAVAGMST